MLFFFWPRGHIFRTLRREGVRHYDHLTPADRCRHPPSDLFRPTCESADGLLPINRGARASRFDNMAVPV